MFDYDSNHSVFPVNFVQNVKPQSATGEYIEEIIGFYLSLIFYYIVRLLYICTLVGAKKKMAKLMYTQFFLDSEYQKALDLQKFDFQNCS